MALSGDLQWQDATRATTDAKTSLSLLQWPMASGGGMTRSVGPTVNSQANPVEFPNEANSLCRGTIHIKAHRPAGDAPVRIADGGSVRTLLHHHAA